MWLGFLSRQYSLSTSGHDTVVPEAVIGHDLPQLLARVAIESDQSHAGGTIETLGTKARFGDAQCFVRFKLQPCRSRYLANPKPPISTSSINANVTPLGLIAIGIRRQLNLVSVSPDCGSSTKQAISHQEVNAIVGDDIIRTAPVGAWNMNLIVFWIQRRIFVGRIEIDIKGSQILEIAFPDHATRVDIATTEAIHPLDIEPSTDNLFRWTVSMTWQHIHIAASTKPQHTQR